MLELLAAILSEFAFSAGPCRAELLNYLSLLTLALAFGKVAFPRSVQYTYQTQEKKLHLHAK
jgi:hypothetical protein